LVDIFQELYEWLKTNPTPEEVLRRGAEEQVDEAKAKLEWAREFYDGFISELINLRLQKIEVFLSFPCFLAVYTHIHCFHIAPVTN